MKAHPGAVEVEAHPKAMEILQTNVADSNHFEKKIEAQKTAGSGFESASS
jgi:hypothetical protein